jgi:hypothetical protein
VFTAPRHHHDFEQLRISMTGVQDFGQGQVAEEGWIGFPPIEFALDLTGRASGR